MITIKNIKNFNCWLAEIKLLLTRIPSPEIRQTSTIRSAPLRDRMNSRQTSPCSRIEQIAFLVRCLVAFNRAVVSGGVNLLREWFLSDGTTMFGFDGCATWHWQVPIREQILWQGEWWLQFVLLLLLKLWWQGLWWQLCLPHWSSNCLSLDIAAGKGVPKQGSPHDWTRRFRLSGCVRLSGNEWALCSKKKKIIICS